MNIYSYRDVEDFINSLINDGYDCFCVEEGVLSIGNWICLSNDPKKWNFETKEVYLNEWCSGQTLRKFKKLSKRQEALLDAVI